MSATSLAHQDFINHRAPPSKPGAFSIVPSPVGRLQVFSRSNVAFCAPAYFRAPNPHFIGALKGFRMKVITTVVGKAHVPPHQQPPFKLKGNNSIDAVAMHVTGNRTPIDGIQKELKQ